MNQAARNITASQIGANTAPIGHAVLFVSRASIRPVLRQELKSLGIADIQNVDTVEACIEALVTLPAALLVIDWEHGAERVNTVLKAAQGAFNIDTRPIFLIATEVSTKVVATAAEYYVSRVHTGEISRGVIQAHLEALVGQEDSDDGIRASLTRIADARMRGDWAMATALIAEMQAEHPDHHRILCELIESHIHEEKWGEATAVVEHAAASFPDDLRVNHLRARCLMHAGDFDGAAALLAQCKLINPFNIDRLVDLGTALMHVGRLREALASFDEALALEPGHKLATQGKAQVKMLEGDVNSALELLRQMGDRELASVFNNAAILSIRQTRFDQGLHLYRTALSAVGPRHRVAARLLYNLALAYHKQGREDEALEAFEQAWRIDRLFDKARHNAVVLAAKLGRRVAGAGVPAKSAGAGMSADRIDDNFTEDFAEETVSRK